MLSRRTVCKSQRTRSIENAKKMKYAQSFQRIEILSLVKAIANSSQGGDTAAVWAEYLAKLFDVGIYCAVVAKEIISPDFVDEFFAGKSDSAVFNKEEEEAGGKQQYLLGLRESGLRNPELLSHLYDMIIENYDYVGNYLILLFHDAYDVITKTNDDLKLDESEEVYTYLLCAICPVNLSKPGLGYREAENRIGVRIQDWVVGVPDVGFLYPSFIERSTDIHTLTYYVRDAKDSHADFIEAALGCGPKRTATEEKDTFHAIVKRAIAPIIEKSDDVLLDIQENLHTLVEEKEAEMEDLVIGEPEEFILTAEIIKEVLTQNEIPDATVAQIQDHFVEEFQDTPPAVKHLVDEKAIEKNQKAKKELKLLEEVASLRQELKERDEISSDVSLRINPEKADQIKTEMIDGQKYLMIPVEENEQITLNGVETTV